MIDAMSGSDDPGVVNITSKAIANGQTAQITLSEGLIKGIRRRRGNVRTSGRVLTG